MSALAPCSSCVRKVGLPAKLNSTLTPGLAFWNSVAMSLKESVRDAAAKTVTLPDSAALTVEAAGAGALVDDDAAPDVEPEDSLSLLPQATSRAISRAESSAITDQR